MLLTPALAPASIADLPGNGYRSSSRAVHPMLVFLALVLGAIVGSFLNVCIARIPAGESIVLPGSHCRRCHAKIRPWDNVPLLSFLLLRGHCRDCGETIAWRYPLVEVMTAGIFAILVATAPITPSLVVQLVFLCAMIVITFIDFDHHIIPDVISLPGIVVGLVAAGLGVGAPLFDSVVGVLLGGGMLWAIAAGYHALTGVEGMGGGDIKLLAMIGAFLGWKAVLLTVLIASTFGSLYGVALMVKQRGTRIPIPFGPFLAFGAVVALYFGDDLVRWYMHYVLQI